MHPLIRIGTVVESKIDRKPFRRGCTYRITGLNETTFAVGYFEKRQATFPLEQLETLFNVISDFVCPTCLKGLKVTGKDECKSCLETD
jgi:hypothetical protein